MGICQQVLATWNGKRNLPKVSQLRMEWEFSHKQISHELFTCPSNFEFVILSTWELHTPRPAFVACSGCGGLGTRLAYSPVVHCIMSLVHVHVQMYVGTFNRMDTGDHITSLVLECYEDGGHSFVNLPLIKEAPIIQCSHCKLWSIGKHCIKTRDKAFSFLKCFCHVNSTSKGCMNSSRLRLAYIRIQKYDTKGTVVTTL